MSGLYDNRYLGRDEDGFDHVLVSSNPEAVDATNNLLESFRGLHTYFYGNAVNSETVLGSRDFELREEVDLTYKPSFLDEIMAEKLLVLGMVQEQLIRTQGESELTPMFETLPTEQGPIEIYRSNIPQRLNVDAFRRPEWTSLDSAAQDDITREAAVIAQSLNEYYARFRNGDFRVLYNAPNTTLFNNFIFRRMLIDCSFTTDDVLALVIKRRSHFEHSVKSAQARVDLEERIRLIKKRSSNRFFRFGN